MYPLISSIWTYVSCRCLLSTRVSMHLLDLPHELLSCIVHVVDLDTLRTLSHRETHPPSHSSSCPLEERCRHLWC
ncbi:hypothetical protein ARMGADRAFT_738475 [Armillaria gallica]|uniref:F-box domain-containing protein n=1 Tax=Armillaria gallica TaxID=47427 RepID=A0A2H3CZW7_ARMGA|nr:hypothetical protein ARMGADRAFT_738475 [Armillaria gallica]